MSLSDARLNGMEPSFTDDYPLEDGYDFCYCYTTNWGQARISPSGKLLEAIFGLGRNQESHIRLEVQIDGNAFRCSRSWYASRIQDEIYNDKSISRSHAGNQLNHLPLTDVLKVLLTDDNFSIAAVAVKRTLLDLIQRTMPMNKEEKALLKEVKAKWRKPIVYQPEVIEPQASRVLVVRKPIMGIRKPIISQ